MKKSTTSKKSGTGGKKKKDLKKKVKVGRGVTISKAQERKLERKPGSSNTGEYAGVSPANFAGRSGGASPYSFPINIRRRAISALARAHFAPDPEGIKRAVYKKFPDLNPKNKKGKK